MKFRIFALALYLLLLSGCGDQFGVTVITTGGGEPEPPAEQAAISESSPEPETEAVPEPETAPEAFFETLPGSYMFCSGAGGWSTDLELASDGSFTGVYHDSEMGAADPEKFPGGTVYICNFSGQFARPVRIDETTWSMEIASLELEHPADETEEIIDGVRCIYSEPYGLEGTETMTVYLPDTPVEGLSEEVLWAARGPYDWQATAQGTLGLTILYNEEGDCGFAEYPMEEDQYE